MVSTAVIQLAMHGRFKESFILRDAEGSGASPYPDDTLQSPWLKWDPISSLAQWTSHPSDSTNS